MANNNTPPRVTVGNAAVVPVQPAENHELYSKLAVPGVGDAVPKQAGQRVLLKKDKDDESVQGSEVSEADVCSPAESAVGCPPASDVALLAQAPKGSAEAGNGAVVAATPSPTTGHQANSTSTYSHWGGALVFGGLALGMVAVSGRRGGSGPEVGVIDSPDTTAPVVTGLSSSGGDANQGTITLTFSESLDGINLPLESQFNVTTSGQPNPVTNVAVSGNQLTLTLQNTFVSSEQIGLSYVDQAGNQLTTLQDIAGNDVASFSTSVVADGYVRGAQIYLDANRNGIAEEGEAVVGVVTGAQGGFFLAPGANPNGYAVIAVGGVNIDTGVINTIPLMAPAGSTVINPLTTLIQGLVLSGASASAANAQVLAALGLPENIDLSTFDPLAAANADGETSLSVQKAAAQVATLVSLASSAPAAGLDQAEAVALALDTVLSAVKAAGTSVLDLSGETIISAVLDAASDTSIVNVTDVGAVMTSIGSAADFGGISTSQADALDKTSPAAPSAIALTAGSDSGIDGDLITSDTTPTLRIRFDTLAVDGTAVAAGNLLVLKVNDEISAPYTLTAGDIATGYVDIALSELTSEGSYAVTGTLTDLAGNVSEISAALELSLDKAPIFTSSGSARLDENIDAATTVYTATSVDSGNATIYSLGGTDASLFNINSSSGEVSFKASPNFEAPADSGTNNVYDITVTATDGAGNTTDQAVAITVTNVNEAPTVTSGATASVAENASGTVYTVTATDPDADTVLSYSLGGSDAGLFNINSSTGAVSFVASPNFEDKSSYSIEVSATDNGTGTLSDSRAVTVSVTDVNEAPTAVGTVGQKTAVNGQAFNLNVSSNFDDVDGGDNGTLSYSATGLPGGLSINSATGVISGTATADRVAAQVVVTASDGGGLSVTQSFNLGVVSAPTITALAANVAVANSGDALTFTATLSEAVSVDTTGGTPTLTLDVGGQVLIATYSGGSGTTSLSFTATAGADDDSTVSVSAINLNGASIIGNTTAQALVTGATGQVVSGFIVDNTAPSFTSGATANVAENEAGSVYASAATDVTTLAYALGGADAGLFNINSSSGAVSFKAAPNFEAPADSGTNNVYDITVTATDGAGNTTNQSVAITVTNVNEAPTVTSGATASVAENGSGTVYTVTATDPDAGTVLSYSLGGVDAGLFNINSATGAVSFKVSPNFEAPGDAGSNNVYDITVTATDNGSGTLSNTQAVAITVTNVNEAPTVTSGATASFAENASGTVYTVAATDPDADTVLSYSLGGADAGLFEINSGTGAVSFKAAPNFEDKSSYSIEVSATDNGTGTLSDSRAVTVSVTDVNEAPTAVGTVGQKTAVNGQAFNLNVSSNFDDVDGGDNGTLSYSATGLPGGLSINSTTGVISGTATADRVAELVDVTATDGGGLSVTQSFNLGVVSAPLLQASSLDNVTNLDVTSSIVLNYDQDVTAVAGKFIHIINEGGTGFRGESTLQTLDILVTDTTQVTISGGKITLNSAFDLDLANNYHITLDEGAFTATSSGLASAAFDGTTSLNFSTVIPGTGALANAVASQAMDAMGVMVAGHNWLDIEGIGSPSGNPTALDLVGGNYALVAKDYDPTGGDSDIGYDGIALGDLNVRLNNFALGDLIYIDGQGNNLNALNDLTLTGVLDQGLAPTPIQFAGTTTPQGLGGFIEVSLLGSSASFDSINALNQLVVGTAVISA